MPHLYLRSRHARLLGMLSLGVALVACQLASTATTIPTAAPPSAPVATAALVAATAVPLSVTPQPTRTLAALTALPTDPPSSPDRIADRLPSDQLWLLVADGRHGCGAPVLDYSLIAIDHAGEWTRLNRRVTAIARRPGLPPLLATCTANGAVSIVDTGQWTNVRIAVHPGFFITQFAVSPDGKQAVFCHEIDECVYSANAFQNGALIPSFATPPSGDGPLTYLSLRGWGRSGLYYMAEYDTRGSAITLYLGDPANPQAIRRKLAPDYFYILDSAHDRFLRILYAPTVAKDLLFDDLIPSSGLLLSDLHQGTTQMIEQAAWITPPVFAPDGMALAYFRAIRDDTTTISPPDHRELVVVDITHNTKTVLTDTLTFPLAELSSSLPAPALIWSQDSQRIIIGTKSHIGERWAAVLTRDGTLINKVSLPFRAVYGITSDDQLMLPLVNGVIWLPLWAGATPAAPDMIMDGPIYAIILPSVRDGAPPPIVSTNAAQLPVTQLPAPAASTPTPTHIP